MVPPNPRISPEEELKIVRKFLKKNNIDDLIMALSTWCCHAPGARVSSGRNSVPQDDMSETSLGLGQIVHWDTDGFIDAGQPDRVTIPEGFEGRYFIHVALQWYRVSPGVKFTATERNAGFFYAFLAKNGVYGSPLEGSRTTTAPVVKAKYTTQKLMWEGELAAGDFVELRVRQSVAGSIFADAWLTLRRV